MRRLIQKSISLSLAMLLSLLSVGIHVTALSSYSTHTSNGTSHGTSSSSCISICALVSAYKNELTEREDDEPPTPFYLKFQASPLLALQVEHRQQANRLVNFEPPPGSPAYIRLAVFRA